VPVQRDVTCNVTTCVAEQREGTCLVSVPVTENVTRKVQVCKTVAYTETVKVLVAPACESTCSTCSSGCSACATPCSSCGHRRLCGR
jgi:hypothetical protein